MSSNEGFEVNSTELGKEEFNLRKMGEIIGLLSSDYLADRLPRFALAPAGEPARWQFNAIEADLEDQYRYARQHSIDLGERIGRTKHGYDVAESEAAKRVLAAVADAREPDYSRESTLSVWNRAHYGTGFTAVGAGLLLGMASSTEDAIDAHNARQSDKMAKWYEDTSRPRPSTTYASHVSDLSKRTQRELMLGKRLSWSLIVAGLAWESLVIPSDEDLFNAQLKWLNLQDRTGDLFGHSAGKVREAIAAAWEEGLASDSSDARLVAYMAAGAQLANRVRRLSKALRETIEELQRIYYYALWFSGISLGFLLAVYLAGPGNPVLQAFRERIGSKWATMIIAAVQLAPAAYFLGLTMHRFETANDSMKIGGRTIDGFKPLY
ncbi:hypothetical protein FH608_025880 [Nonomuraea phyllanthi]|uniref:Uncharacterized protein n=1 Tax=Nonomuraea phyllanthi TaxID=2219224 RepID=A0A5C4W6W0_9ACTN|nr:MFS transporter [Nonomuraea phyllanthi]KAB8192140.1 hypothetical protein FH608_025880 [Nonomuraea phyllanthi]